MGDKWHKWTNVKKNTNDSQKHQKFGYKEGNVDVFPSLSVMPEW